MKNAKNTLIGLALASPSLVAVIVAILDRFAL